MQLVVWFSELVCAIVWTAYIWGEMGGWEGRRVYWQQAQHATVQQVTETTLSFVAVKGCILFALFTLSISFSLLCSFRI